jgi:hypothetical protein
MRVLILRASTLHQKKMNHEDAKSTKKSTKRKTFGEFARVRLRAFVSSWFTSARDLRPNGRARQRRKKCAQRKKPLTRIFKSITVCAQKGGDSAMAKKAAKKSTTKKSSAKKTTKKSKK